MSQQSPYEQIRFINDAIKDRQDKNQPTFFSVKLERFGAQTPLVNKEPGANFYETIIQYLTKYDMQALIIELFNAKSHNVKDPFQTFKIPVKRSQELSGLSMQDNDLKVSPTETVITTEKHFFTMAEKERQVMLLEFDLKRLQYEVAELTKKNKKKKRYIQELEDELGKTERAKKQSFGNVSLGLAGANAIESFAKSTFGIGILKNVFGMKEEMLNGLLGNEDQKEQPSEPKSTASIISNPKEQPVQQTKEDKVRAEIKKYIAEFLDGASDSNLRLYYELIQYLGADTETLSSIVTQVKSYREKQKAVIEKKINSSSNTQKNNLSNTEDDPDEIDSS